MEIKHTEDNYHNLIKTIDQMFERPSVFNNFINRIIFPFYKNFELDSEIHFNYPFTVLVGKNGCGKSSALHALYGCPKDNSTADFWFSTHLDPIVEAGGIINSYIYEFTDKGKLQAAHKARTRRSKGVKHKENLDYWETRIISKRRKSKYGLTTSTHRDNPINKNVVYLDFRSELSAFDQYFYFGTLNKSLVSSTKQDYIRLQTTKLKNLFENATIYNSGGVPQNEIVAALSNEELKIISFILGKTFVSGKIIKHKLFGSWGTSIFLEKDSFKYSEAHAGSGEIAIVKLVHTLLNSPNQSLVLLDEPEVSLHPGAQRRLKIFLLELIKEKKHQIIVSTHSPNLVENLPRKAIKLFTFNPETEKVKILNNCLPDEAFYTLGQTLTNQVSLIVEDKLAYNIIKKVTHSLGEEKAALLNVEFFPGGAQTLKKSFVKHYAIVEDNNKFFIFDGDQDPKSEVLDLGKVLQNDYNTNYFKMHIDTITMNAGISFDRDGNSVEGGRDDQLLTAQEKFIRFYRENVFYLPTNIPEEIIWDEGIVFSLIDDKEVIDKIRQENNLKQKIKLAAQELFSSSDNPVDSLEGLLISKWIKRESKDKELIVDIINNILDKIEKQSLVNR
ncbi:putative ATPase [Bacillus sp. SORGH_AS 510]|uniref:ATP-dependent nuclease n=1 Tax=Bacillus sp. SORGH_AS_0510 TaxID=3041771 RepID=UPI00278310AE|nr:ATP-binding protein [Bacillus sp. SORGH_AS_0510]MDQ1147027.1 putative ATPase [Bacillus sp. SORGH_AS_0510]